MEKTQYLRLVATREQRPIAPPVRAVPLDARPYRPGELPQRLVFRCDRSDVERAAADAARAGLPVPLWVRIAVEASRVCRDISAISAGSPPAVERTLDAAATAPLPTAAGCRELSLYARAVLAATPSRATRHQDDGGGIEAMVPDTVRAAWTLAATRSGMRLDAWVAGRLENAPARASSWEAQAAACGLSIGEWAYGCWLACSSASASAAAQTVD